MSKAKTTLRKPTLSTAQVLSFAEGRTAAKSDKVGKVAGSRRSAETAPAAATGGQKSRFAPAGDFRLTVNMRDDLHQRLKIEAVKRRTTVGELLETLVERMDDVLEPIR
jgi:hypothetical protein